MRKKLTTLCLLCFFTIFGWTGPSNATAQDNPGDGSNTTGFDPDQKTVPIDGGLTLLLAAGAAYGVKKYRAAGRFKNGKENNNP